ncbi:MAG TPA: anthranilate synthase component I family protein [Cyclobacteriaceae bacterium]|nr:anthranilate synthase component I family protein [Cyclobacteriaceae bacterium]
MEKTFPIGPEWINKLLNWSDGLYPYIAYFDPHSIAYPYDGFAHLFFAGEKSISLEHLKDVPENLEKVGILSYDLKNHYESLYSKNTALVNCDDSVFFIPTLKIKLTPDQAIISNDRPDEIFEQISAYTPSVAIHKDPVISSCTTKETYVDTVKQIKNHIVEGDIYEMNYCMAFSGKFESIDVVQTYFNLSQNSPMPFGTFFKAEGKYVVGASPERFLKKTREKIIAQPIKGSIKRGQSVAEDEELVRQLQNSEKERAENLMIVDLMRNDLSKISETGKVQVEELFGIYSFKRISQMISTVSSTLMKGVTFEGIIKSTFPMGSMTGAPKIRCMELIDQYENFRRGWFSGAIGYITAEQDFDFNVVIRSIVIDQAEGKLFFAVGSAITYDADPLQEYEECLLKAQPIFEALAGKSGS